MNTLIKLIVVPNNGKAYALPIEKEVAQYHVEEAGSQKPARRYLLEVTINKVLPDWAPNGVIRVEGFTKKQGVTCGVIGFYQINSLKPQLGILEIQDA